MSAPRAAPPDTVALALRQAEGMLSDCSDSPRLDAELLLAQALDWPRSRLFSRAEQPLPEPARKTLQALLARRAAGEPIAYLRGEQEFWSLSLRVGPACLIPRPETEGLVDWLLEDVATTARVLDLGTGSGAIALALKQERPDWRITAVEFSHAALAIARDNGTRHGLAIDWRQGSWYAPLAGETFDAIVSNPPYVAEGDPHLADLACEPPAALTAGPDGLDALRAIIAGAPAHLAPGGCLRLEHGFDQGPAVRALLQAAGFTGITTRRDLAGLERLSGGNLP